MDPKLDPKPDPKRWPTEIRLAKDKRSLRVAFDDGSAFELAAEYLRVTSPAERKTVPGKRDVQIIGVEPVGNYAVKLVFDDMHSTGIFGWDYLHALGAGHDERWADYLADLGAKGLSREPAGRKP